MSNLWMPLYVAEYLGDTGHLSTLQHGAYLLLIMHYWQKESPLPDNDKILAQITRLRVEHWLKVRPELEGFFTIKLNNHWIHNRVDRELQKAAELREKRQAAAAARWCNSNANALQADTQLQLQKNNSKILDFSLGKKGKKGGLEMTPENRLSLFHNWLAPLLGPDGWKIIAEAMNPESEFYAVAVETCKVTAKRNGKGWPHQWPK